MKPRSLLIVLLVVLVVASAAYVLRADGGGLVEWLSALHGPPRGH